MSKHLARRQRRAGRVRHEPPAPKPIEPIVEAAMRGDPYALAGFSAEEAAQFREHGIPANVVTSLHERFAPKDSRRAKLLLAALFSVIESANLGPEPDGLR